MYADASDDELDESSASRRSVQRRAVPDSTEVIPQRLVHSTVDTATNERPSKVFTIPPIASLSTPRSSSVDDKPNQSATKNLSSDCRPADVSKSTTEEVKRADLSFRQPLARPQTMTSAAIRLSAKSLQLACTSICNGEKDHLSMACHLFPRISETNLQFHDISWNHEDLPDGRQRVILRKRMVKVCALLRIGSIRMEKRGTVAATDFEISLCLVDGRPRADNQIVSNRHTPACCFIVRSNYAQPEVRLRISLRRRVDGFDLGAVELALLDDTQRPSWRGGSASAPPRSHIFGGGYRMNFELSDIPTRQAQMQADFLPDVLICDEGWSGVLACYRQMTCEIVARNRESLPYSTMISDLVLTTFPRTLDNRPIIEAFIRLLVKERILTNIGDLSAGSQPISCGDIKRFRSLYLSHVLPVVLNVERGQSMALDLTHSGDALAAISQQRCVPLIPTHYILHLAGSHALD